MILFVYQSPSVTPLLNLCFVLICLCFFLSDQNSEVKLGNPLLVLLQAPFQLLSHLLFDRQVSPDRYVQVLHGAVIVYM